MLRLHPADRLVRHVHREVIIRVVRVLHADGSVKNGRRPLVGLTPDESVELVETRMCGPTVVRSGNRHLPRRSLVVFAEGGGAVTVEPQHLR